MCACVYRDQKTTFVAHLHTGSNPGCQAYIEPSYCSLCFLWFYLFIFWFVFVFQTGPLDVAQAGLETQNSLFHVLG